MERLDRFLLAGKWEDQASTIEAIILPLSGLDHFPVQLTILPRDLPKGSPFKFESMWLRDESLLELVAGWWDEVKIVNQSNLLILSKKLGFVKTKLKEWNRLHFKNIFQEKERVEQELATLNEHIIKNGMREEEFEMEKALKEEWTELLKREESYW